MQVFAAEMGVAFDDCGGFVADDVVPGRPVSDVLEQIPFLDDGPGGCSLA